MKRVILLLIAVVVCIGISACSNSSDPHDNNFETGATSDKNDEKDIPVAATPQISIEWLAASGIPKYYIEELGWIVMQDPESGREFIYDRKTGKLDVEFDTVCPFSEGMAVVSKYDDDWEPDDYASKRKYGFIDDTGKIVIPLEYDLADNFCDGMASVRKLISRDAEGLQRAFADNTLEGVIDKTGAYVIPLELGLHVYPCSEGLISRRDLIAGSQTDGIVDKAGNVVVRFWNSADGTGEGMTEIKEFSEGLAPACFRANTAVGPDWKYGYIDATGAIAIQPEYDNAFAFSDGLAMVGKSSNGSTTYGYINKNGEVIVPIEYEIGSIWEFSDGMARVKEHGSYGFLDQNGELLIPLQYKGAGDFSQGLAPVATNDWLWGFIDKTGKFIINAEYDYAFSFCGGVAPVAKEDSDGFAYWGFIDQTGNVVVPLKYESAGTLDNSIGWVENRGQLGIFDLPETR